MSRIYFIFHNGHQSGELTHDCKLRIFAAKEIVVQDPEARILFIGGGGLLPETGVETMLKYWQEKFPEFREQANILDCGNNTATSIGCIMDYAQKNSEQNVGIISNKYHLKRIAFFAGKSEIKVEFLAAEEILSENSLLALELKKYLKSCRYKTKQIIERILFIYVQLDQKQKLVKFWRTLRRKL